MPLFLTFLVIVTLGLFLFKLARVYNGRFIEKMVTNYFKAAEALVENDSLPQHWIEGLERIARTDGLKISLVRGQNWRDRGEKYLLDQIGKLRKFYTTCPYFDGEEAREHLLDRIDDVITRWQSWDISQITQHYGVEIGNSQ